MYMYIINQMLILVIGQIAGIVFLDQEILTLQAQYLLTQKVSLHIILTGDQSQYLINIYQDFDSIIHKDDIMY
jgi:hypothetical protein